MILEYGTNIAKPTDNDSILDCQSKSNFGFLKDRPK